MGFAGYVAVCVQLYCRCFTVLHLVGAVFQYIFRPTWPSSGVGCFYFHIPEGVCFAGFTCTWLPFARFHLWGGLNMRYYFDIMGYYYLLLLCYVVLLWYVCFYFCFFVVLFSSLIS
jgi:hypothetical protein